MNEFSEVRTTAEIERREVKTIADVEAIIHGSGKWDGTGPVEFSNDGSTWTEAWAPSEDHPHPQFARVSVHRKDVTVPKRKTIRWDDYVPKGDGEQSIFWLAQWTEKPSRHFDRIARMVNYREMFRDVIGDIVIDGEKVDEPPAPAPAEERDWAAEIEKVATLDELDALDAAARKARVFTPDTAGTTLHRQVRAKRKALADEAWKPAEARTLSGALSGTTESHGPAMPRDFLAPAGNRAERRARTKKKGRR